MKEKLQHFNLHLFLSLSLSFLSRRRHEKLRFPAKNKKKREKQKFLGSSQFHSVMYCFYVDISHCFHDEIPQNFLSVLDFRRSFYLADTVAVQRDNYVIMLLNHVTHIEKVETQRGSLN